MIEVEIIVLIGKDFIRHLPFESLYFAYTSPCWKGSIKIKFKCLLPLHYVTAYCACCFVLLLKKLLWNYTPLALEFFSSRKSTAPTPSWVTAPSAASTIAMAPWASTQLSSLGRRMSTLISYLPVAGARLESFSHCWTLCSWFLFTVGLLFIIYSMHPSSHNTFAHWFLSLRVDLSRSHPLHPSKK